MPPQLLSRSQSSYILTGLTQSTPHRQDNRGLHSFRPIQLSIGHSPSANGSSKVNLAGTEVICGIKAEVKSFNDQDEEEDDDHLGTVNEDDQAEPGGRIKCSVDFSPCLLHSHDQSYLEALTTSLTSDLTKLYSTRSSPISLSLLSILPNARHWLIYIDVLVNSISGGNLADAVFSSVYGALFSARLPSTRTVAFDSPDSIRVQGSGGGKVSNGSESVGAFSNEKGDLDKMGIKGIVGKASKGGNASKKSSAKESETGKDQGQAVDFELEDSNGEGWNLLKEGHDVPVCVTVFVLPNAFFLDATQEEEACTPCKLHVVANAKGKLYSVRMQGGEEVGFKRLAEAIKFGTNQARDLCSALNQSLKASTVFGGKRDEDSTSLPMDLS